MIFTPLSQPIEHGPALCDALKDFLIAHKSTFQEKLIPDLSYIDDMAHNVNGIEIQSVHHLAKNRYQIEYSYDWDLFLGCSDINQSGTGHDHIRFTLDPEGQINMEYLFPDELDTSDEL
ncbi:hypothetical protein LGV68_01610 [Vibrio sp. LQ2]|uniref:hypothetical protein n=1 Tax=Vibrio sp. LQ2 TaxID=2883075 RepID=UPI00208E9140|nr:hypothetical protein [Vibrio sp. LQ2]USP06030.1 hypothetical protein LGV68_01610 [Vibrio sp. LQ2]